MDRINERVIKRLDYDIDELTVYRDQCLNKLCKIGEKLEKQKHEMETEVDPIKIGEMIDNINEICNMFEELRVMYNDAIEDVKALIAHKKDVIRISIVDKEIN